MNMFWGPKNHGDDIDFSDKKILVILPGLNGSSESNYVK